jgi:anti-sigma factor (TIGR02949 family)
MPCQELVEVVTDYLDGALTEGDRDRFETHLAECEDCRTYLDQIRRTVALVGRVDADALPDEIRDGLLAAFRGWRAG